MPEFRRSAQLWTADALVPSRRSPSSRSLLIGRILCRVRPAGCLAPGLSQTAGRWATRQTCGCRPGPSASCGGPSSGVAVMSWPTGTLSPGPPNRTNADRGCRRYRMRDALPDPNAPNYTDVRSWCLGEGKRRASVSSCLRRLVVTRRSPYVIELSAADRAALEQRARAYTAPHHQVMRAKIVLLAAAGVENTVIADRLDVGGAAGVQVAQAVLRGGPGRVEGSPADRSAAGLFPLWRW